MRDPRDRPNIILVNADDLGWGDLGCYGHPAHRTPHLDRMAAEGMRFTDFYQASSLCSASRGAMLTGCYPRRIGFDRFGDRRQEWVLLPGHAQGLDPGETTFARVLKSRGYATCCIGKWHCGDQAEFLPTRHGFDRYYGLPYSNDMGRQLGRMNNPPLPLMRDETVIQAQPEQAGLTERYVEEAIRFIRVNREQPFLLYFAQMYVHLPLYVQDRFLKESDNGKYGAAVACIDWSVGAIMSELRQCALDGNTLVLFTSDNGSRCDCGASNGMLRGGKGTAWEGGMRLPLLAWWPGAIPAGTICPELTAALDFLPTFARLAGAQVHDDRIRDGKDITPLMLGEPDARSPHESFFYYHGDSLSAVRSGKWKLFVARITSKGGERVRELYDLQIDPGETTDVAGAHPEVVRRLEKLADACRQDLGDAFTNIPGANVRPIGTVGNPKQLTTYDQTHPYVVAMYDLSDWG